MQSEKITKRVSLKTKLIVIFGLLVAVACTVEGVLAIYISRKAVSEKVETHLKDKAADVAEIIDGRINSIFQFLEGIARMPFLRMSRFLIQKKKRGFKKKCSLINDWYSSIYIIFQAYDIPLMDKKYG